MHDALQVIQAINAERAVFQTAVDRTKQFMTNKKIPQDFQDHVKQWCVPRSFTKQMTSPGTIMCGRDMACWTSAHTCSRCRTSSSATWLAAQCRSCRHSPVQALLTHINVLRRVRLFSSCGEYVLRVAAMALRQRIYSPGDFIILKGEIGNG